MRGPEGGFYSALDADSEGVEGRFYVWTHRRAQAALGEDADAAIAWFGASEEGNFATRTTPEPGLNVLTDRGPRPDARSSPSASARACSRRASAASARAGRQAPDQLERADDRARWPTRAPCSRSPRYTRRRRRVRGVRPARAARRATGGCCAPTTDGHAKIDAYLEDHAFLLEALIALFEASCEERWFRARHGARRRDDRSLRRPAQHGGFFSTAADGEALIARRKDLEDTPIPSGARAPRSACCGWPS